MSRSEWTKEELDSIDIANKIAEQWRQDGYKAVSFSCNRARPEREESFYFIPLYGQSAYRAVIDIASTIRDGQNYELQVINGG